MIPDSLLPFADEFRTTIREDNYIIDLGFKFNISMDPNSHIDIFCKTLDYMMILAKNFSEIAQ